MLLLVRFLLGRSRSHSGSHLRSTASKDEILSDNYDLVEVDDVVYEVQAKVCI